MNASAPGAVETLAAARYREPAHWAAERAAIFARSWQFFAPESQLVAPGDWVAEAIAGYPLVVVRDEAGTLRGYHNVCRHRAGPLTEGAAGTCPEGFTCRYHGWRYALDGRLRQARDFGPAADFDPRDFSLFSIRVETWRGLVFVCIDGAGTAPLDHWVAPLERRLAAIDWSGARLALRRRHDIRCNWKTYVENYLEGYHVPVLHPGLDAEIDSARYAVTVEDRVVLHEAPLRRPTAVYQGLWAWLWPNLGINIYGEGLMLERMVPVGHGATRLDYLYLTPDGRPVPAETLALSDQVTAEDVAVTEAVQANLDAGVYRAGRLSPRHEGAVAAFQARVRAAVPDPAAITA